MVRVNRVDKKSRIYIAGHTGMVGSAIERNLIKREHNNLILKTHTELDLTKQVDVEEFFRTEKPEYVFIAAAHVGGIQANNTYPADFYYINMTIQNNVIHSAYKNGVKKLLLLGSTCIYPPNCRQPIREEYLLSDYLEPTNEAYAIAKIAGIKMCQYYKRQYGMNFISCTPANVYGPNDNFDLNNSHVIPAVIRKFHEAKIENRESVEIWGSGYPRREFLHVDDMADATVFIMQNYDGLEQINVGTGEEVSIRELTEIVKEVVGYSGDIVFDHSKPDGCERRICDTSKLTKLGWRSQIKLVDGIAATYKVFIKMYHRN